MGNFIETLQFLGLSELEERAGKTCSFWRGTEAGTFTRRPISLLQIRQFSTVVGLEEELKSLPSRPQHVIATTISKLDQVKKVIADHGLGDLVTEQTLLYESAKARFRERKTAPAQEVYIEPRIIDYADKQPRLGLAAILPWLRDNKGSHLAIITGNAGFGKTTFSRKLCDDILALKGLPTIPIYIDTQHWKRLVREKRFTMRGVFTEAVAHHYPFAAIGEDVVEHLIAKGAILPIFDGLDEICSEAYTEAGVEVIVQQMESLFDADEPGAALFTSRSTFWNDVKPSERLKLHQFEVLPFDSGQRKEYLDKWFAESSKDREFAEAILSKLDNNSRKREASHGKNVIRFSESPYFLRLICLGATNRIGSDFSSEEFINRLDPLDSLVDAATSREIEKSGIPKQCQAQVLFAASLCHGEKFSADQLDTITRAVAPDGVNVAAMQSHHFITDQGSQKAFLFDGLADYLRAKAFVNWLFREDDSILGIPQYLDQLTAASVASVDVFAEIANYYMDNRPLSEYFGAPRVLREFCGSKAQGLMLLLAAASRRGGRVQKREMGELISRTFLDGRRTLSNLKFRGLFLGFDFREFVFERCEFVDVVFKECLFSRGTSFCRSIVSGEFEVVGCEGFGEVESQDMMLNSMQARAAFSHPSSRDARRISLAEDIRATIREALRQLNTRDEAFTYMNREGLLSRLRQKNSYLADSVVEALLREGALSLLPSSQAHRARLEVNKYNDVLAFWRDGAEIGAVRQAVRRLEEQHGVLKR